MDTGVRGSANFQANQNWNTFSDIEMMGKSCSYCDLATKIGDLYCSRTGFGMEKLDSGIFIIEREKVEECEDHVTRLSLNINFTGHQRYFIGKTEYVVGPNSYLLINEGQKFRTVLHDDKPNLMVTLAFRVGLADEILQAYQAEPHLTDNLYTKHKRAEFIEKVYHADASLKAMITLAMTTRAKDPAGNFQHILENILERMIVSQLDVQRELNTIQSSKYSTRVELYKRLHGAKDFIEDSFRRNITVSDVAKHACLSTFHFKRLFRELFHIPPYQYIKMLRLNAAKELLSRNYPVKEVCKMIGWDDASSFGRLFKKKFSVTPKKYGLHIH
jgi:AraC-like DNA-binding protein